MPKNATSETSSRRPRSAIPLAVVGVTVLVAAAWFVVARARTQVKWTAVMEAANAASTINGLARLSGEDGTQWDYSLWSRVEGPGAFSPKGMLVPVRVPKGAKPSDLTVRVAGAVDYCGPEGVAAALAGRKRSSRGRWTKWGGNRVLKATVHASEVPGWAGSAPDEWRFYLEPHTRLVQGVEIFANGALRGRAEYRYNQPLPPAFAAGTESRK